MGTFTGVIVGIVGTLLFTALLKQVAEAEEQPQPEPGTGPNQINVTLNDNLVTSLFF